jgi:hypothetical protein
VRGTVLGSSLIEFMYRNREPFTDDVGFLHDQSGPVSESLMKYNFEGTLGGRETSIEHVLRASLLARIPDRRCRYVKGCMTV